MQLAQQRVGSTLRNKWRLDCVIDVGGMAAVYLASHRNGHRAAIKILHPAYNKDEQARTRFLREGYAANAVGHRGAVAVLDDDVTDYGEVYIVMELLDGESLEGRLAREKVISPLQTLLITDQVLEVLSQTAAIAIERHRAEQALLRAKEAADARRASSTATSSPRTS